MISVQSYKNKVAIYNDETIVVMMGEKYAVQTNLKLGAYIPSAEQNN